MSTRTATPSARPPSFGTDTVAIRTPNGVNYLTVVNNGGLPPIGRHVAIASYATSVGPNETFAYVRTGTAHLNFALQCPNGVNYVTAVNGGGMGGPNDGTCPIHTDAAQIGPWETLTLEWLDANKQKVAIKTSSGYYLSAVDGGGIGDDGRNSHPIHTDASKIGPWETFAHVSPNS